MIYDQDSLLTTKDTARLLGLTPNSLEKHRVWNKGLPYVKVGRTVRYRYGDILDVIARGRVVPASLS